MIQGAWVCLLAPLMGAVAITVMGESITRRTAGWISTVSVFAAFAGAIATFVGLQLQPPRVRAEHDAAHRRDQQHDGGDLEREQVVGEE